MALHEMSTHPGICGNCTFEVHEGTGLQIAEIRAPQRLRRDADLEPGFVECRDREAGSLFSPSFRLWFKGV
jgi:hypothetical protein